MPKFLTSQEWLEQSALLTKITTKYNLPNPKKPVRLRKRRAPAEDEDAAKSTNDAPAQLATLEVRTYNPQAGIVLKYSTTKGWEVARLMAGLGRLARNMAALPEIAEDVTMLDAKDEAASGTHTPSVPAAGAMAASTSESSKPTLPEGKSGQGPGGGGKKKKKGKR